MAVDYTVIQSVRQRFGDGDFRIEEQQAEQEAPFVGRAKDFPFSCPNVDAAQMAILQLETLGLTSRDNLIAVNGVPVPGGLTPGALVLGVNLVAFWKSHSLLVPAHVLRESNVLHIECAVLDGDNNFDNFILDNVVILFKTRLRRVGTPLPDKSFQLTRPL